MFKLVLLSLFLLIVLQYQYIRYRYASEQCLSDRDKDIMLLSMEVCQDPDQKYRFKELVDCHGAEQRMLITVRECTLEKWVNESHLMKAYFRIVSSHWTLVGIIVALAFWWMWLWSKRRSEAYVVDRMGHMFDHYNRNIKRLECK